MIKLHLLHRRPTVIILSVITLLVVTGLAWAYASALTSPLPDPSEGVNPGPLTVSGQIVCLPHKNTSGPQTLECAMGLKSEDGRYYGLRYQDQKPLGDTSLSTETRVTVHGTVAKPTDDEKYDVAGNISVDQINRLNQ